MPRGPITPSARADARRTRRSGAEVALVAAAALATLAALLALAPGALASHGTNTCDWNASGTQENGWYRTTVTLTMTTSDASPTSRSYSVDGGSMQPYTTSVTLSADGAHTITCQVVDHAGQTASQSRGYNVDRTAPTSCVSANVRDAGNLQSVTGGNGWYSPTTGPANGVLDDLVATDATSGIASMTASVDGGASVNVPVGGSVQVRNEGQHTVSCTARDLAGNTASFSHTIRIDTSAPTCSITASGFTGSSGWTRANANVSMSFSDGVSGIWHQNYTVDGGAQTPYTTLVALAEGTRTVMCIAKDNAGNVATQTRTLRIDTRAPTSCSLGRAYDPSRGIDLAPTNGWHSPLQPSSNGIQLYFDAVDVTSGLATLTVSVDGAYPSTLVPSPTPFLTLYNEGTRTLSCTATDVAGNSASFPSTVRIDATPPTCTGSYSGATGTNGWHRSGAFVATASDGGSGIWYLNTTVAGTPASRRADLGATGPSVLSETIAREGSYVVACVATDAAGLTSTPTTTQVRLDTVAPTCDGAFDAPVGLDGWHTRTGRYTLNATDSQSGVAALLYALDNAPDRPYAPFEIRGDGEHSVRCTVTDLAGHTTVTSRSLKLDATPPTLCVATARGADGSTARATDGWYRADVDVELVSRDAWSGLANLTVELDGAAVPGVRLDAKETKVTVHVGDRGKHSVRCVGSDRAGNAAAATVVPVNIDDSLPLCAGRAGAEAPSGWHRDNVTFTLSASDTGSGLSTFEFAVDGDASQPYRGPLTVRGDGSHRVECRVWDLAGNAAVEAFDLRIDATPPACLGVVEDLGEHEVGRPPATLVLRTSDETSGVARLRYALNGAPPVDYAEGAPIVLAEPGVHEVVCHVEDRAGNANDVLVRRVRLDASLATNAPEPLPAPPPAETATQRPVPFPVPFLAVGLALLLCRRR